MGSTRVHDRMVVIICIFYIQCIIFSNCIILILCLGKCVFEKTNYARIFIRDNLDNTLLSGGATTED